MLSGEELPCALLPYSLVLFFCFTRHSIPLRVLMPLCSAFDIVVAVFAYNELFVNDIGRLGG